LHYGKSSFLIRSFPFYAEVSDDYEDDDEQSVINSELTITSPQKQNLLSVYVRSLRSMRIISFMSGYMMIYTGRDAFSLSRPLRQ